ncbi:hypothetical protein AJ79_08673 [Helicocarpus griseus UAMH5409]|uniref:Altered inheritance of mitochondria protein 41 n=1 Tax=Helicocarpus griseus UAMH5409 TaxID=1447875 RepID=A0A2B7WRS7_9EURO|nr:hypothetical protein AJ79_08673 [Helicocarpus griseus UAMH5409]
MFRTLRLRPQQPCLRGVRFISTASEPPLLRQIRSDLRDGMRAKDQNKTNVIRAIIAEANEAAKSSHPITTDIEVFNILRKRVNFLNDARKDYVNAGRTDLCQKTDKQLEVLGTYMDKMKTLTREEIQAAAEKVAEELRNAEPKVAVGRVLRRLLGDGGVLEGKPVDRAEVARVAGEVVKK